MNNDNHFIVESKHIVDVLHYVTPQNASQTIMVFDVDNTLGHIQSDDGVGTAEWFETTAAKMLQSGKSKEEVYQKLLPLFNKEQLTRHLELAETKMPDTIHQLQQSGLSVMGITRREAAIAERTLQQLNEIGINFNLSWCPETYPVDSVAGVIYKKGILFVHPLNDKAVYLKRFLIQTAAQHQPYSRLIVVDDERKYLEQMLNVFNDIDTCIGIRYGAFDELVSRYKVSG